MKTLEIDIPDDVYRRGVRHSDEAGITFSELCSLGVVKLIEYSDDELDAMSKHLREENEHE